MSTTDHNYSTTDGKVRVQNIKYSKCLRTSKKYSIVSIEIVYHSYNIIMIEFGFPKKRNYTISSGPYSIEIVQSDS